MNARDATWDAGCVRLLRAVAQLGIPHGIEDSFKCSARDGLCAERVLVAVHKRDLPWERFLAFVEDLGLPPIHVQSLREAFGRATHLGFAVEDHRGRSVWKLYLEFWDEVRAAVRATHARRPVEMNLGLKWENVPDPRVERAHYLCHPLLNHEEVLHRLHGLYGGQREAAGHQAARRLVKNCARRWPTRPLIYLEASEEGNGRHSFDLNFYRTDLRLNDACEHLLSAGIALGISTSALAYTMGRLGPARLGHLSGGIDRHGAEFLSVYTERQPL